MVFLLFIVRCEVSESNHLFERSKADKKEEKGILGDNTKAKYLSSLSPNQSNIQRYLKFSMLSIKFLNK